MSRNSSNQDLLLKKDVKTRMVETRCHRIAPTYFMVQAYLYDTYKTKHKKYIT